MTAKRNRWAALPAAGRPLFPRADAYGNLGAAPGGRVRETAEARAAFPWSERHLQAVWYDPALRPPELRTEDGELLTVEDPGVWNLEAGPDFVGARVLVGEGRRLSGDVEVHVQPKDWLRHGHGDDPRYARVRLHVTWAPGRLPADAAPKGLIQVSLKAALAARPLFSFDLVDPAAYPYGPRATPAPCSLVLAGWRAEDKEQLLEAAGEERLRRKAERLAAAFREKGRDQALYEELLCALGYKHNKAPFRLLAERVPLDALREEAGASPWKAYALLAGVAGLLPARPDPGWDEETRGVVRRLWDAWWKQQDRWAARALPEGSWRWAGLRPVNRPERRLMAAAELFTRRAPLAEQWLALARRSPGDAPDRAAAELGALSGAYWARRCAWGGPALKQPAALIGPARAQAIVNNLFLPFLAASEKPFARELLDRLPAEPDNQVVRQTARSLLGPDYPPSLLRSGLRQQGLIQVFNDYCLNDRSRCAGCPFPGLLRNRDA